MLSGTTDLHKPAKVPPQNKQAVGNGMRGYTQFDPAVFAQEGMDHRAKYEEWLERTKFQLSELKPKTYYRIPPITHSTYLTHPAQPIPMKDLYIDNYVATSTGLSESDPNFKHYLWANFDPDDHKYSHVIPQSIRATPGLKIRNVDEFKDHPLFFNLQGILDHGNPASKFVEASDIARVLAMQQYGGVYHDLDWKLYRPEILIGYMKTFHYLGGQEGTDWFSSIGNAFFANKAGHPVINKLAQLMERNLNQEKYSEYVPDYIKFPAREFDRVISQTGPIAMTIAYHLASNQEGNVNAVLPCHILYNVDYARDKPTGQDYKKANFQKDWEGIKIETIGGDQFSGNWGKTYLQDIEYKPEDLGYPKQEVEAKEMFMAIEDGGIEAVKSLIAAGADLNAINKYGYPPLHIAIITQKSEIVRLLLAAGADLNAIDKYGYTPLYNAIITWKSEIVRLLLDAEADVNAIDKYGDTPLHIAARHGKSEISRLLLAAGADLNAIDKDGYTPLHNAIITWKSEIVRLLLDAEADVNAIDKYGKTPLHIAARHRNSEIVTLLLDAEADVNAKDKDGNTPLHIAARQGNSEIVRLLLDSGADVNAKDNEGEISLDRAQNEDIKSMIKEALAKQAVMLPPPPASAITEASPTLWQDKVGHPAAAGKTLMLPPAPDFKSATPTADLHYAATTMLALGVLSKMLGANWFSGLVAPNAPISSPSEENPYAPEHWQELMNSGKAVKEFKQSLKTQPNLRKMADAIEKKPIDEKCSTWNKSAWDKFFKEDPALSEWIEKMKPVLKQIRDNAGAER